MGKNNSSINLMSQGSRQEIKTQAIILATFVAIFWLLEILDQFVFNVHPGLDMIAFAIGSGAQTITPQSSSKG